MKKLTLMRIILGFIALVIYLNIGYLFAYSFDPFASPTSFSKVFYKTIDFMNVVGMDQVKYYNGVYHYIHYLLGMFFWPALLFVYWLFNSVALLLSIFFWLFTGGIFRWLELIK